MKPENLKFILKSYIECKQIQDDIDGPGNSAVEFDNPIYPRPFANDASFVNQSGFNLESLDPITPFHSFQSALPSPNNVNGIGRRLARMARQYSTAYSDKSFIKFRDICLEKEPIKQIISIPVMRDQNFSDKVTEVSWKTCDKTAMSGIHYVESSGEIIFNQGETSKDIQIQILYSAEVADDLRFTVELNYDGLYTPNPMTVSLRKVDNLDASEKMVLRNLPCSLPFSLSDIKHILDGCLNVRTFRMALTHLCSTNNAVDIQIALACELSSLCLYKSCGAILRPDTILKALTDFFRMDEFEF